MSEQRVSVGHESAHCAHAGVVVRSRRRVVVVVKRSREPTRRQLVRLRRVCRVEASGGGGGGEVWHVACRRGERDGGRGGQRALGEYRDDIAEADE